MKSDSTTPAPSPAPESDETPQIQADWKQVLGSLKEGIDQPASVAELVMADMLTGAAGPARMAAFLMGLATKGESVGELTGMSSAMTEVAHPLRLPPKAIDIVGTGGSAHRRSHALNVSTMASVVAAGAGAVVCKHGNRKATSTSGSFDFLEALGVAIELQPTQLQACVEEIGLGFAFARVFHPAMRFAAPVRADLGIPTAFNLLGPLSHPGRVRHQVVGVASAERGRLLAEVLRARGAVSSLVVAGHGGLDEISTTGRSQVWRVTEASVEAETVDPAAIGLAPVTLDDLAGGAPSDNAKLFERMLAGETSPARDIVCLNAGAGLLVAGLAENLGEGFAQAAAALDDGRAAEKLEQLRSVTNRLILG